jgi:hypothetical protein
MIVLLSAIGPLQGHEGQPGGMVNPVSFLCCRYGERSATNVSLFLIGTQAHHPAIANYSGTIPIRPSPSLRGEADRLNCCNGCAVTGLHRVSPGLGGWRSH